MAFQGRRQDRPGFNVAQRWFRMVRLLAVRRDEANVSAIPSAARRPWKAIVRYLQQEFLALHFDLLERMEFASTAAGAFGTGLFPSLGRLDVRVPEGPSATLARACVVDGAFTAAVVKEDAVATGKLDEASSYPNLAHVVLFETI